MTTYPYVVKSFVAMNIAEETLLWQPPPPAVLKIYGYSLSLSRGLGAILFKDGWGGKIILTIKPSSLNLAVAVNAPEIPDKALAMTSPCCPLIIIGVPQAIVSGFLCAIEG